MDSKCYERVWRDGIRGREVEEKEGNERKSTGKGEMKED